MSSMDNLRKECSTIEEDFMKLETALASFVSEKAELIKRTDTVQKAAKHQAYTLKNLSYSFKSVEAEDLSDDEKMELAKLRTKISDLRARLDMIKQELPVQDNGFYLSLILGSNLNISLGSAIERYKYKQEYEQFKYKVTLLILLLTLLSYLAPWRVVDSINNFVMVWYYCTLTIRESILRHNGSKIKGWWVAHHYLSCVFCGVTLTWRDGECYNEFRPQFLVFIAYVGVVQIMQHKYQAGCLRRLHALGQGHEMDITMEGFSAWMFKGLTFLLPFLCLGYVFQLANAYVLWKQWMSGKCDGEWQVWALSLLFLTIALGNISTTFLVIIRKFKRSREDVERKLRVRTKTE